VRRGRPSGRRRRLSLPRPRRASRPLFRSETRFPRVLLDGDAPGPSHGVDVDGDGHGLLREGRL
jgi:hypothetical protein